MSSKGVRFHRVAIRLLLNHTEDHGWDALRSDRFGEGAIRRKIGRIEREG